MSFKCFFLNTAAVVRASEQLQTAVSTTLLLHVVRGAKIPLLSREDIVIEACGCHMRYGRQQRPVWILLSTENDGHVWPQFTGLGQALNLCWNRQNICVCIYVCVWDLVGAWLIGRKLRKARQWTRKRHVAILIQNGLNGLGCTKLSERIEKARKVL